MTDRQQPPPERRARLRIPKLGTGISLVVLGALLASSLLHVGDAKRFASLLERAEPAWVFLAVAFQLGTYLGAGGIWSRVAIAAGYRLRSTNLARLSIEKLGVDQLVPTGGVAGNVVVVHALRRMGLPSAVATEALLIDVLSHYAALAGLTVAALLVLAAHHRVTRVVLVLLGVFSLALVAVPATIVWLLRHRTFRPGPRLARIRFVSRLTAALTEVSTARIWNVKLLFVAATLQATILLLDAGTLWALMKALGSPTHPLTAFVAIVIATIAGMVSFLPGGIGSFEAASTATLALLGVPVEAALTGTLLLRGFTLWLPLLPGVVMAHRDLSSSAATRTEAEDSIGSLSPGSALQALFVQLGSRREGLTSDEARERLLSMGPNALDPKRKSSALTELLRSVASPLSLILLTASAAALFLGEVVDAAIIVAMVLLSAAINLWQSSRSARTIEKLQSQITPTATVLRDRTWTMIPRQNVVIGDIVRLSAGALLPADARLVESTDLHVLQAALTGESAPAAKLASEQSLTCVGPDARELVFAGTSVVSGTATAVVFATGKNTAFGDIAARLAARPEETEFERGSRRFGMLILQTVFFLVLFILVVSFATGRGAFQSFLFAVALAVGLTPEYLPMITTVTLAQGAARMAREKVIVKHLASIQNLGSIDVLCSDKTGTLTSGTMSLDASLDPLGKESGRALLLGHLNSVFETGVASALDSAILERPVAGAEGWRKVAEIPFDFERRRLSVIIEQGDRKLLVTKGAPESVLPICGRWEADGEVRDVADSVRETSFEIFRGLCAQGYRVLAVAYREVTEGEHAGVDQERNLTLAGFLTFSDQLIDGVDHAIESLERDGVTVKILSGDNDIVTQALCRKAGVDATRVVTGDAIEPLDETALARVAADCRVFARVSPAQKHRIVMALKHHGHVVGFMGDGINDAPALHGADVGISVAGAVDVAQEASDILLLEKRLDVLHAGIVAGRRSFANVFKYLLMGTSSNFGNMLSMAGAVFVLPFLPMLPTQILVNNFLYDLAQVTIPTDNVDPAYVKGPQRWNIGVIKKFMLFIGPVSSVFDFLTFGVLLFVFHFQQSSFQTGWFIESLSTQVLVLFVIRTVGRPWTNRPSLALTMTVLGVLVGGLALPFTPLAIPLGMTPLPVTFFLFVAAIVPAYLVLVEIVKHRVIRRVFQSVPVPPGAASPTRSSQ